MNKIIAWFKTEYPKVLQYLVNTGSAAIISFGVTTHWHF